MRHPVAVLNEMKRDKKWDKAHGITEGSWQDEAIDAAARKRAEDPPPRKGKK